jgi:hypothetical protein
VPDKKKKIVLPILAGVGLVLLLWLAFHDRSVAAPVAMAAREVRPSSLPCPR